MKRKAKIYYISLPDEMRKEDKLAWLRDNPISKIKFERITPDAKNNWINQTDNDWDSLLPLIDKDVKAGKSEKAIFKLFSSGLKTQRDEWVYDFSKDALEAKMRYFVETYEATGRFDDNPDKLMIKWDAELDNYAKQNIAKEFEGFRIYPSLYRPFVKEFLYFDKHFNGRTYQWFNIYLDDGLNRFISISGLSSNKPFQTLASNEIVGLDCLEKTQCLPLYYKDAKGKIYENITDWAVQQFQTNYQNTKITKEDIFYYTYGVLHSPQYRKKYEQNLKREFPRLPFYADFTQWRDWGKALMNLHINYETIEPFALGRKDLDLTPKTRAETRTLVSVPLFTDDKEGENTIADAQVSAFVAKPKTKLRADKINGSIEIDSHTTLTGVPDSAWEYKLGNRSALEWILDQYKEKKPQDATIAERFNTYKFEDYKEQVIELLKRVCNVSVKTMKIVNQMPNAE